jgi:hypothetical protein
LTAEEISAHEMDVHDRIRSDVILPKTLPQSPCEKAYFIGKGPEYVCVEGEEQYVAVFNGMGHRVLFHLEEMEATDAVEQMIEEFADEHLPWLNAIDCVSRIRRGQYNRMYEPRYASVCNSRAALRRAQGKIDLPMRLLEYAELLSMFNVSTGRLIADEVFESLQPPPQTNRAYWHIKKLKDWDYWVAFERRYFHEVPDFVQKVYEVLPWLCERGYTTSIHSLLFKVAKQKLIDLNALSEEQQRHLDGILGRARPHSLTQAMEYLAGIDTEGNAEANCICEVFKKVLAERQRQEDAKLFHRRWAASRKPGIKLRPRPQVMFKNPEYQDICPCCGDSRV